jgi:hypothetical protein
VGVTAAVVLACAGGAFLYSQHHMQSLLETARSTALAEGDLIRVALEHQMIENKRTLIAKMIESFRKQSRGGAAGVAGPHRRGALPRRERSPGLRTANQLADLPGLPPLSARAERIEPGDRDPRRQSAAHRDPHPQPGGMLRLPRPRYKINGILILDYRTDQLSEAMTRDLRWLVGGTAAITLLLVGAIGVVIRVAVLRRLQRFETTARQIAGGDLAQRVPSGAATRFPGWRASSTPWPIRSPGWWEKCATSANGWKP